MAPGDGIQAGEACGPTASCRSGAYRDGSSSQALASSVTIHCRHLPPELLQGCPVAKQREGNHLDAITRALEETGGNRRKAAELLGISRATLYRRLKKLNIPAKAETSAEYPGVHS